ncbi:DUF6090 family protein [Aquiflexum sp. TKW24L]|uniref:DUF6090 family protein n=1 Tax=Aquiflexum sp. TKW24L TaxID=2942212 RepID=UPI0020C0FF63|nr:DUF6090 family protein [Aquiflexum sp. TKW24L]MCL6257670.1 DUF6090 family protein [Aquiflexum sp. TKW24L]
MIRFFRKIRQKLLEQQKVKNYLLYAIGEIFLVVIGILIAININDWNNRQTKIANEKVIMASLVEELSNREIKLKEIIQKSQKYAELELMLLNKFDSDVTSFSQKEISDAFDYLFFFIDSPILDEIIIKNSDVLVRKKFLMDDFRTLAKELGDVSVTSTYLDDFWSSQVTPFFLSCGISYEPFTISDLTIELKEIESAGYSKKQIQALIKFKITMNKIRSQAIDKALLSTQQTLEKLQNEK